MFGIFSNFMQNSETSPYPRCPRHAHHTVTVRDWFHLYLQYSISEMLMSINRTMSVIKHSLITRTVRCNLAVHATHPTIKHYLTVQHTAVRAIFAHTARHTKTRFAKYRITQDRLFESDFDRFLELEESQKKMKGHDE